MNNKSNSKFYTYKGQTKTVSQWAREFGVSYSLLYSRLKAGYDFEMAVTRPPGEIIDDDEWYYYFKTYLLERRIFGDKSNITDSKK